MVRLLEWVNRIWPIKFGTATKFGSTFKFGGKTFER